MAKIIVLGNVLSSLINFRGKLLEEMVARGHRVSAATPDDVGRYQPELERLGVRYLQVPLDRASTNPLHDLHSIRSLLDLFRRERPDVVFSYTTKPVLYGSLASSLARVPLVSSMITGLGYAFSGGGMKRLLINRIARLLYYHSLRNNQVVFFQNPDDMDLFRRLGLVHAKHKVVLVNGSGVDVEHYRPAPLPSTPSFLLIARLIEEKGVRQYVEAARNVKSRYPHVRFRLVGFPDKNPTSIQGWELESWQSEGVIEYLGRLYDVRPAIADASVYVLPSYYREGVPRSILEAMSMGRAIVTTDSPGCRETVRPGINGFLVPTHDAEKLALALERFLIKPQLQQSMGEASRRLAVAKFDVRDVNRVILGNLGLLDEAPC
jgi:glycosyltransferase involved in cell wall biosynthesis